MLAIEKGVAIPEPVKAFRTRQSKYPFAQMAVGDSFHVEGDPDKVDGNLRNVSYRFAKNNGVKFTVRRTETGARIWRVA